MAALKHETSETSSQLESCSVCLDVVQEAGGRSTAKLKCGHHFHLDCIGSAFNAKGAMQCPNCRHVEDGQWLYANGNGASERWWSDELFHEELPYGDEDPEHYISFTPDFIQAYTLDHEEPWPWCPYQLVPPQSAGSNLASYLAAQPGDNDGTGSFSPSFEGFLNVDNSGSVSFWRPFCPVTGHGLRSSRQSSEDYRHRPTGHGPDARESALRDGSTVTERWSTTERGLYGWGRRSGMSTGQSGASSFPSYADVHSASGAPALDVELHLGRTETPNQRPTHRNPHSSVWSSIATERQVGSIPYNLWEVHENSPLRRSRSSEPTRGSTNNYERVLNGSISMHSLERPADVGNPPASYSPDRPSTSSLPAHGMGSSSSERGSWGSSFQRAERCDTLDIHMGNTSQTELYPGGQGPSLSQQDNSTSSSASGTFFSVSTPSLYNRRTRGGLPTRPSRARATFPPSEQSRRLSSLCPWLSGSASSQEPTLSQREAPASWRQESSSRSPSDGLQAEWRSMMRSGSNVNSAISSGYASSSSLRASSTSTSLIPEGQGSSPRGLRGDGSRVVGRMGVLPSSYSYNNPISSETTAAYQMFRHIR